MTSPSSQRTSLLAAACGVVLLAGWLLLSSGPTDARAQGVGILQGEGLATGPGFLQVRVVNANLRPGIRVDQVLVLDLAWTASLADVFVERSHGVIRFWNSQGDSFEVAADVQGVQPGDTVLTSLIIDWNEQDAALRLLRRDPETMQAAFTADGIRTVSVGRQQGAAHQPPSMTSMGAGNTSVRNSLN